jgi:hypothetical protein
MRMLEVGWIANVQYQPIGLAVFVLGDHLLQVH